MNRISQEAHSRQVAVKLAMKKGKSFAAKKYGMSLSSVKRWCKRYDGTWQSLRERSHRPESHPRQHTPEEEEMIRKALDDAFFRYGWEGSYVAAKTAGYTRSYSGFLYAARRMGLCGGTAEKKPSRKHDRRYPEQSAPAFGAKKIDEFDVMAYTLATEAGFYLDTDIDEATPFETGMDWTIDWSKEDFLGKAAVEKLRGIPKTQELVGITMDKPFTKVHGGCVSKGRKADWPGHKVYLWLHGWQVGWICPCQGGECPGRRSCDH